MGILLRNWHLKLSAVLLATVLYTGLVFSGSLSEATLQVRVDQVNVSRDQFVLSGDLGLVEVRYRGAAEDTVNLGTSDFVARVDISAYDMERAPEPQQLPIEITSLREGVTVLSTNPETVRVEVDRIEIRPVPVEVEPGVVPEGLEIGAPVVSAEEVQVRGPASLVERVDRVVALVSIPASGIDINEAVDLTPVDIEGQPVGTGMLDIEPETVSVQVDVRAVETQTTAVIRPNVEAGAPAPGFALEALGVEPSAVDIVGLPEDRADITSLLTEPIDIVGVSESQTFEVALQLPDGVELAPGEPATVTVVATIVPSVSSRTFVVGVLCEGAGVNACLPGVGEVAITLSGSGEAWSGLQAADLTPVVDASGLAPGSYSLTPVIGGLPAGVELLAVSPTAIPVTIVAPEAAPTPTPTPAP